MTEPRAPSFELLVRIGHIKGATQVSRRPESGSARCLQSLPLMTDRHRRVSPSCVGGCIILPIASSGEADTAGRHVSLASVSRGSSPKKRYMTSRAGWRGGFPSPTTHHIRLLPLLLSSESPEQLGSV